MHREAYPGSSDSYRAPEGYSLVSCKPAEDLRFVIRAPGYLDGSFGSHDLPEDVRAGKPFRVTLEPGFDWTVTVVDGEADEPIAGANLYDGAELLATTDGSGAARLVLPRWPTELRVVAGELEETWTCDEVIEYASVELRLYPDD